MLRLTVTVAMLIGITWAELSATNTKDAALSPSNSKDTGRGGPNTPDKKCTVFGDKLQCGCYLDTCWAYLTAGGVDGQDRWCYTEAVGEKPFLGKFQSCKEDGDCSWVMECGELETYTGNATVGPNKVPAKA